MVAEPVVETPSPGRKTILSVCCTVHAVQDGLTAAIYVILPVLAQSLGLNYGQVGLLKALKSLAQAVLEIYSGIASEKYGERALLVGGMALAGGGYVVLSFADGQAIVLLSLFIVGVGVAFQHAPSSALVSHAFSDSGRRGALGLYNSSGDAGKLIFTAGFSLAMAAGLAWQQVTLGFGLVAIAAAFFVVFVLKAGASGRSNAVGGAAPTLQRNGSVGWGILDKRGFLALLGLLFLDGMVQAGVLVFIAFVMIAKGIPLSVATLAAVCVLVGGMCGKAACGFLAEKIGVRQAFVLVQSLTAIGIVAVVVAPNVLAYVLLPFLGVVLQGSTSITYGMVDDLVHRDRKPRGFALAYAASSMASVVGPLGFGLIGDRYGISVAMIVMAVVAVVAIPPCWLLSDGKKSDPV